METNIEVFIYFLAGITFSFAAINLTIGLQKGSEKTYLFLGLSSVCVGIYYLLFPQMTFKQPLSLVTKVGFFFFLANFALLPWFLCHYTTYCKFKILWLLTAGMAVSYLILLLTTDFTRPAIWNILAHLVLMGVIIFGFKAALRQKKRGDIWSATLLSVTLAIFSLLTIDHICARRSNHIPAFYHL